MRKKSNDSPIAVMGKIDVDDKDALEVEFDEVLHVLPLRDTVIFPGVVHPIAVGREASVKLVHQADKQHAIIALATQTDPDCEDPTPDDLYPRGVAARVLQIFETPADDTITVLLQALSPIRFEKILKGSTYLTASVVKMEESEPDMNDEHVRIMMDAVGDKVMRVMQTVNGMSDDFPANFKTMRQMPIFLNFCCTNMPIKAVDKQELLAENDPTLRAHLLMRKLNRELQYAKIRHDLESKTQNDLDKQQHEFFLQQEMRNIQEQLGGGDNDDVRALEEKAQNKRWTDAVKKTFDEELQKLRRYHPQSPDYQVQYNFLSTMLKVPWGILSRDNLDLKNAQRVLDKDHYGMKDVKERILEHLAVRQMRSNAVGGTILCLYGPPGVGKTSLCRSIASAMKREYVRVSLGGMHDEAEIRGHRRTYVGAMPGRIVKSLIKAGTSNPIFVLDEIDKVAEMTHNGDPSSALLEVLDPEQNMAFHDNFLDVDVDLSQVLFIATANNIGTIPRPLLDRMELIEVSGYVTEEKIEIARRHLEPRIKKNCGLEGPANIHFNKKALEYLIEGYTRESGVRGLEKELERYYRRSALFFQRNAYHHAVVVNRDSITDLLGKPKFSRDMYQGNEYAGVVTGLAWTSVGGEILFIESSVSKGKGGRLTLTGNLGDVMKESAMLALEYVKAHTDAFDIDPRLFEQYNIHVHVPEGAVPKDGPSAGVTMVTSIASVLTQRKVREGIAMTGEITLRGKVLAVGGIKEKILAAKRAGIKDIVLCADNRKDIEEIDALYLKGMTFHYVKTIGEVLDYALLAEKVDHPVVFNIENVDGPTV